MAGKSRIAFIIVIRFVPGACVWGGGGRYAAKPTKWYVPIANSEGLDQPGHSKNGGEILDLNIYLVHGENGRKI